MGAPPEFPAARDRVGGCGDRSITPLRGRRVSTRKDRSGREALGLAARRAPGALLFEEGRARTTCLLVVDDEPDALELLQAFLGAKGYEVLTASDGEEALQKVKEERPTSSSWMCACQR